MGACASVDERAVLGMSENEARKKQPVSRITMASGSNDKLAIFEEELQAVVPRDDDDQKQSGQVAFASAIPFEEPNEETKVATDKMSQLNLENDVQKSPWVRYHAFLSHAKRDAAAVASQLKTKFENLLHERKIGEPKVFLDSDDLADLRTLKPAVKSSANFILILTSTIFQRPWCQIEIHSAVTSGINIIPVVIEDGSGIAFDFSKAALFVESLTSEAALADDNIKLLKENDVPIHELQYCLRTVLEKIALPFSVSASSNVHNAQLADIIHRMVHLEELVAPVMTWLSVSQNCLEISSDCQATLQRQTGCMNLITMFGAARQGKSFLMNCLSQKGGLFPVSEKNQPCTQGVHLARKFQCIQDFSACSFEEGSTGPCGLQKMPPTVGFVDCEGQGDNGQNYDLLLAIPVLLVSKIIIFNWMGRPNKDDMLQRLALLAHAAGQLTDQDSHKAFGDLFIVLRDCPSTEGVKELVLDEEDVSKGKSRNQKNSITSRNSIRHMLSNAFTSINFFCLPLPHPEIMEQNDTPLNSLSPKFLNNLDELRNSICNKIQEKPHYFGGQAINGPLVNQALACICKELSEDSESVICPTSIIHKLVRDELEKTLEIYQSQYVEACSKVETFNNDDSNAVIEKITLDNECFWVAEESKLKNFLQDLSDQTKQKFEASCKKKSVMDDFPNEYNDVLRELETFLNKKNKEITNKNKSELQRYLLYQDQKKNIKEMEQKLQHEKEKREQAEAEAKRQQQNAMMGGYSSMGGFDCDPLQGGRGGGGGSPIVGSRVVAGQSRAVYQGPRGGRYYMTAGGNRKYI